jgi:hypothetical protein
MIVVAWTFQADNGGGFQTSAQRFGERGDALEAAIAWLEACAANDFFPAVRVWRIEE